MKPIDDMLNAFEMHYAGARYTDGQRAELQTRYGWIRNGYKVAIYDAVTRILESSLRSLPDTAIIERAIASLDDPAVYEPQLQQLALPETGAVDRSKEIELITKALIGRGKLEVNEKEVNHEERKRIRVKVLRGDATDDERFWISCIDDYGGDWKIAFGAKVVKG